MCLTWHLDEKLLLTVYKLAQIEGTEMLALIVRVQRSMRCVSFVHLNARAHYSKNVISGLDLDAPIT